MWLALLILVIIVIIIIALIWWRVHCSSQVTPQRSSHPSPCITSAGCSSGDICYNGTCIPPPSNDKEMETTRYSRGTLCTDRHLMKMVDSESSRFTMLPGWFAMNRCVSMCPGMSRSTLYIVRDDGVYLCGDTNARQDVTKIQVDISVSQIVNLSGSIYMVDDRGVLHRASMKKVNKWVAEPVRDLCSLSITGEVTDISSAPDGSIAIRMFTDDQYETMLYDASSMTWKEIDPDVIKVSFGERYDHRIEVHLDRIEYRYCINRKKRVASIKVKCVDIHVSDGIIHGIDDKGRVFKLSETSSGVRMIRSGITGQRLLSSGRGLWLLTDTSCRPHT